MSTALYRRYRPETFADVIGQEHVTDPLRAALRADRVTHAYLFSGPRGCGKTTSARIFARCLNCAEGPTDTPCGTCPSCVELARAGAGSLDVIEMDAASHGGVDDARELRERATFAPARDRYKIFIIDEAHMVTSQGFNALLKLVEEPPAHVKFVFATTEPEKVIGTIRSRTHHYPFRLVPPERLQGYLEELCAAEGVSVATGVLPLVVRAGGGSVRDSLSVLDQLIAGAQDGEVSYERAVALLGYTHATLLDDVVDALAARDGASLFRVVDRVIDSGHDPRRFAEDLLERIRDLVVIAVSGEHAATVLRAVPQDQLDRMRVQSQQLGPAELTRGGDLVNEALTEMSGATSPRLQLELMCARLLLPGADDAARGHAARLDRIERHLSDGRGVPSGAADAADGRRRTTEPGAAAGAGDDRVETTAEPVGRADGSVGPARTVTEPAAPDVEPVAVPAGPAPRLAGPTGEGPPEPEQPTPEQDAVGGGGRASSADARRVPEQRPEPAAPASADADLIRRRWSEVLATLARFKRTTWALVSQNAQVGEVSGGVLHLAFATSGLAHTFRSGAHAEPLQRALLETLGVQLRIEPVLSQAAEGGGQSATPYATPDASSSSGWAATSVPSADSSPVRDAWSTAPAAAGTQPSDEAGTPTSGVAGAADDASAAPAGVNAPSTRSPQAASSPAEPASGGPSAVPDRDPARTDRAVAPHDADGTDDVPASARTGDFSRSATSSAGAADLPPRRQVSLAEDTPSMDDPDAENSGLVGAPLIERMLGGTVISEE